MSGVSPERRRICIVGSANVDLTFRTPRLPMPGETFAGRSFQQCMGGKGANQAVAAARLGASVTFVARVGSDSFGDEAIKTYAAEGIDTSFVQQDTDQPTGTAAILVDDDAENCIVVVAGANARLAPEQVQRARSVIEQSDLVLSQLETPVNTTVEAFRIARAMKVPTMLTPAPAEQVTSELLELCDICLPNKTEIGTIAGHSVDDEANLIRAAKSLRERGVQRVLITLGSDGTLLVDDSGALRIPAMQVEPVDTTGAGDAFTGALAVGLTQGLRLEEAAKFAATVAAISVTRPGTQPSFPTLKEVQLWDFDSPSR